MVVFSSVNEKRRVKGRISYSNIVDAYARLIIYNNFNTLITCFLFRENKRRDCKISFWQRINYTMNRIENGLKSLCSTEMSLA